MGLNCLLVERINKLIPSLWKKKHWKHIFPFIVGNNILYPVTLSYLFYNISRNLPNERHQLPNLKNLYIYCARRTILQALENYKSFMQSRAFDSSQIWLVIACPMTLLILVLSKISCMCFFSRWSGRGSYVYNQITEQPTYSLHIQL
jgi:hypothetical protein